MTKTLTSAIKGVLSSSASRISILECGGPPPLSNASEFYDISQSARGQAHSKTWRIRITFRSLLSVLAVGTLSVQANELVNAGFESGAGGRVADWVCSGNVYQEPVHARSGNYSLKLFGNWTGPWNTSYALQNLPAEAGQRWTFSGFAQHVAGDLLGWDNYALLKIAWFDDLSAVAEDQVMTRPASGVAAVGAVASANLQGFVPTNLLPARTWFEWGLGERLSRATPAIDVAAGQSGEFTRGRTNLTAGMTYQYRAVASNALGVRRGVILPLATPRVRLQGSNPLVLGLGNPYVEQGATVNAHPLHFAAARFNNLILTADGTPLVWGNTTNGLTNLPVLARSVVALEAGSYHALARLKDGSSYGWGLNDDGQADIPAAVGEVMTFAAGSYHSLALLANGQVYAWGRNENGETAVPAEATNVVALGAGLNHSAVLRGDGSVLVWGSNTYGQMDVPSAASNVVAIACGTFHLLALREDGQVVAWGRNDYGQTNVPPDLTQVVAIAAGSRHSVALRADGSVVAWGRNDGTQSTVPEAANNVVAIAATGDHSTALREDGAIFFWGLNRFGEGSVTDYDHSVDLEIGIGGSVNSMVPGAYQIDYTATNILGGVATTTRTVIVNDRPILDGIADQMVDEGSVVLLDQVTFIDQGDSLSHTATIDWGDGTGPETALVEGDEGADRVPGTTLQGSISGRHVYADNGQYDVTVTVTDSFGLSASVDFRVTVYNVSPVVSFAGTPQLGDEGRLVSLRTNTFVDPGTLDTHTAIINWGDGTAPEAGVVTENPFGPPGSSEGAIATISGTHVYADEGSYLVTVTVTDDDGGSSDNYYSIGILSMPPSVEAGPDQTVELGATVFLAPATFNDPGTLDSHVAMIDWGDGTPPEAGVVTENPFGPPGSTEGANGTVYGSHLYASAGFYTVTVTITDNGLHSSSDTLTVTVVGESGVVTLPAQAVVSSNALASARLHGVVPADLLPAQAWFEWGEGYQLEERTSPRSLQGDLRTEYANLVQGLNAGTIYHYRAAASNAVVVSRGELVRFAAPLVTVNGTNLVYHPYQTPYVDAKATVSAPPLAIAAGWDYALALRADREILAWGRNLVGQTDVPVSATNIRAVSAGGYHGLALAHDGHVIIWGDNSSGQYEIPQEGSNIVAISAGPFLSLAVTRGGRVIAWGGNNVLGERTVPADLSDAVDVAAGHYHGLALRANGRVVAWGDNSHGQINVPLAASNVVALAGGGHHSLALRADGQVVAWGNNDYGQTNVPPAAREVVAIAGGLKHLLALRRDGRVVAWGDNEDGQLNVPAAATNIVAVAAGNNYSLALRTDGTVLGWGSNARGQISVPAEVQILDNQLATEGTVNPNQVGTYLLPYSMTNVDGAVGRATRAVTVLKVPEVETLAATDLVNDTGTFQGQVNPNGGDTVAWFEWGDTLRLWSQGLPLNLGDGTTMVPVSRFFNHLTVGRVHYYRLAASNQLGVVRGEIQMIWTPGIGIAGPEELTIDCHDPIALPSARTWFVSLAAGNDHSLGLKSDGTVEAWGRVVLDPWSNPPEFSDYGQAIVPAVATNIVAISAGSFFSLALTAGGQVIGWGRDQYGQATPSAGWNNVVAIAAGGLHGLALRSDRTVTAWGWNFYDQAAVPPNLRDVVAIAAGGEHSLALKSDGSVVAWGRNNQGQTTVPPQATNIIAIAAGYSHNVALKADGRVIAWGQNASGQITVPPEARNVISIAAGNSYSLALKTDGTLVSWGYLPSANTNPELHNIVSIAGGVAHALALRADGDVIGVGNNSVGQALKPPADSAVSLLAAGYRHNLAVTPGGAVFGWGENVEAGTVPAGLSSVASIAAGDSYSLAVTTNGDVYGWGRIRDSLAYYTQANIPPTATNVVAIAAGPNHSLAVRTDGSVVGWTPQGILSIPDSVANIVAVAAGMNHSLALTRDGAVLGWGDNTYGQAWGLPGDQGRAVAIAAGGNSSLALTREGTVVVWGALADYPRPSLQEVVAISAGPAHALALKRDGSVVAWGDNEFGQTNVPPQATNIVAIAAGYEHNMALAADGTVLGWGLRDGDSKYHLTNSPPILSSSRLPIAESGTVNPDVAGSYEFTYRLTSASGAIGSATVQVKVADTTLPTLTLLGDNPLLLTLGDPFIDPWAVASDLCAGDLTGSILVSSAEILNVPGAYPLFYSVTDPSGNSAFATRVVQVIAPPIILSSSASITGTNAGSGVPALRFLATIRPNGAECTAYFEFGRSLPYSGRTESLSWPAGFADTLVASTLDGLLPGVTYHWRAAVTSALGSDFSPDQTFTMPTVFAPGDSNGDGLVDPTEFDEVARNYWGMGAQPYMTNLLTDQMGYFQVALTNADAWNFTVEVSTNLLDWEELGPAWPILEFYDPDAINAPERFYRLRWP